MISAAQLFNPNPFPLKKGHLFTANFGYTIPQADLADRFGNNQALGLTWRYKTGSNVTFGLEYNWLYGKNVNELTMLDSMIGESGEIIDKDGVFSVVRINQRGHSGFVTAGKLFPFNSPNKNSGLFLQAGFGLVVHKIDIMAPSATVPQLNGEYAKGYDRLTGGYAFKQFIGYQNLSPDKRTNFLIGIDFMQARTSSLRNFDFDTRMRNDQNRLDLMISLRIGLTLPIYTKNSDEDEYFFD